MDVRGMATVLAIEPCPPIAPGPGRVVLSTTVRHAVPVLTLRLAGADEVLELTPGHRLFSEDRGDWVPAGELQPGERLRTRTGSVAVAALDPKPGLHTVFNLEVETDHCYLVGQAQVLSHNANPCAAERSGGSYTNYHESGMSYSGMGKKERPAISGREKARKFSDPLVRTDWSPAPNKREAFKDSFGDRLRNSQPVPSI
jgi:hypothetical protein